MISDKNISMLVLRDDEWFVADISSVMMWRKMTIGLVDNKKFEESLIRYLPLHPTPELYNGVDPTPYIREAQLSNLIDNKSSFITYEVVNDSSARKDRLTYAVIVK